MSPGPLSIPFEPPADPHIQRGCGAACLAMVYRSFGKQVRQAEIWPAIAKQNRFGSVASTTHLMTGHALNQGFSAVAIQARHPIDVLRICRDAGIRAILNQRPALESAAGHYTVLVDVDDKSVVVHDPALGPHRRMSHAELMRLWQPAGANSEIAGNVVIGIALHPASIPSCEFCHTAVPPAMGCPQCGAAVGLSPAALLGCMRDGCIARMWNYVACPACDFMFDESGKASTEAPRAGAAPGEEAAAPQSDLENAFALLDKFCGHILSIPELASHPDLTAQIDFIRATKDKVRAGQAEEFAAMQARLDQFAAAGEASKRKIEEHRKKQEDLDAPLPRLDGHALGQALLKNLGFK